MPENPKSCGSSPQPKVALLFETPNAYARGILRGIGEYILTHGPWRVNFVQLGLDDLPPAWLSSWDGQGIILRGENLRMAEAVAQLSIPAVDLTPSRLLPKAPWVKSDDAAVARMAARHFVERGFRNFAFCGNSLFSVSARREELFEVHICGAGHLCHSFKDGGKVLSSDAEIDMISRWLVTLPNPIGVFAFYDGRGQQVLEGCRRAGLAVPEQVAVLGVDNDEVLCMLSPPPMSSVILNPRRAGWEAAALLSLMMNGEEIPSAEYFIPPIDIAVRQSTDILAVSDPQIAKALHFIREHACEQIGVKHVLQNCPMARRRMEMRFRKLLGRTPHQEIIRMKLNRVKELLLGTQLSVSEIAERTSIDPQHISALFKEENGLTPGEFRRKFSTKC